MSTVAPLLDVVAPKRRYLDEVHAYFIGSRRLLGVSEVLHAAGIVDPTWYTDFGRARGQAVHKTLELLDLAGSLDEYDVDPRLIPYVEAYQNFCAQQRVRWEQIECRYWHEVRGYAGTTDRVGYIGDRFAVCDFKTGAAEPFHAVQIAAYVRLVAELGEFHQPEHQIARFGLYLTSDGKYQLIEYAGRVHGEIFAAALAVAQWKQAHGLIKHSVRR